MYVAVEWTPSSTLLLRFWHQTKPDLVHGKAWLDRREIVRSLWLHFGLISKPTLSLASFIRTRTRAKTRDAILFSFVQAGALRGLGMAERTELYQPLHQTRHGLKWQWPIDCSWHPKELRLLEYRTLRLWRRSTRKIKMWRLITRSMWGEAIALCQIYEYKVLWLQPYWPTSLEKLSSARYIVSVPWLELGCARIRNTTEALLWWMTHR